MSFLIKGTVLTPSGTAVPNVNIALFKNGNPYATTVTDASGAYEFLNLDTADYQVVPSLQGYIFNPTAYNYQGQSTDVTSALFRGSTLKISGRVILLDNESPVSGASVVIEGELTGGKLSDHVTTDNKGKYQFTNVQLQKTYSLTVSKKGLHAVSAGSNELPPLTQAVTKDLYLSDDESLPVIVLWLTFILSVLGSSTSAAIGAWIYKRLKRTNSTLPDDESEASEILGDQEMDQYILEGDLGESYESQASRVVGDSTFNEFSEGPNSELGQIELAQIVGKGKTEQAASDLAEKLKGIEDPQEFVSELNDAPSDLLSDTWKELMNDEDGLSKEMAENLKEFLNENGALTEPAEIGEGGGMDSSMSLEELADLAIEGAEEGTGFSIDVGSEALIDAVGAEVAEETGEFLIILLDVILIE